MPAWHSGLTQKQFVDIERGIAQQEKLTAHMSQIAEELTFAVLSVTKLENSRCSWEFLKVSQEAKVAPFPSAWPSGATTMLIGHRGCLKNAKKWSFLVPF